jgi:hypothetical protein
MSASAASSGPRQATSGFVARAWRTFGQWLARSRFSTDNGAALLLAIAALATAWSGYQASLWGGVQASRYTESFVLRNRANQLNELAARKRLVDIALFTQWLTAKSEGRPRVAELYEMHFRSQFRPAFELWQRTDSLTMMRTTPFDLPQYATATASEGQHYETMASHALQAGQDANQNSDVYVFITVILANVLFFAGALRPLVAPPLRPLCVLIASLLCCWAVIRLFSTPLAG